MNILFFLTPKKNVTYIYSDYTLRQAIEKMEHSSYTAVPVIDRDGRYVGTITEGDLLWSVKNLFAMNFQDAEHIAVGDVQRRVDNSPVRADTDIEDIVLSAMNQNFVPVIDGRDCFIGIITRKEIIRFLYDEYVRKIEAP